MLPNPTRTNRILTWKQFDPNNLAEASIRASLKFSWDYCCEWLRSWIAWKNISIDIVLLRNQFVNYAQQSMRFTCMPPGQSITFPSLTNCLNVPIGLGFAEWSLLSNAMIIKPINIHSNISKLNDRKNTYWTFVPSKGIWRSLARSSTRMGLSIKTISYKPISSLNQQQENILKNIFFVCLFTPSIKSIKNGDGPNWVSTPCWGTMSAQEVVGAPVENPRICWTGAKISPNKTLLTTALANVTFPIHDMLKTE